MDGSDGPGTRFSEERSAEVVAASFAGADYRLKRVLGSLVYHLHGFVKDVELTDRELELVVEDNGKGCPQGAKEGLGSRIVRLLAQQLKGDVTTESAGPGCRKIIAFPAGER